MQFSRVGCHLLLQGIFLTQGSNPHLLRLLNWQVDSFPLCHLVYSLGLLEVLTVRGVNKWSGSHAFDLVLTPGHTFVLKFAPKAGFYFEDILQAAEVEMTNVCTCPFCKL